ncbi:hypothetical protein NHJ13051_007629 [Beauveria bassiana]
MHMRACPKVRIRDRLAKEADAHSACSLLLLALAKARVASVRPHSRRSRLAARSVKYAGQDAQKSSLLTPLPIVQAPIALLSA